MHLAVEFSNVSRQLMIRLTKLWSREARPVAVLIEPSIRFNALDLSLLLPSN